MSSTRLVMRRALIAPFRPITRTPTTFVNRRLASQDYGSGDGDPKGEKPQQQGKNPSEHLEHPGPPPPSTPGGGSGSDKGSSQSKQPQTGGKSKGTQGAQPKILNESPPADGQASEEVNKHNREMDNRAEQAHEKVNQGQVEADKVGKGYWSGKH